MNKLTRNLFVIVFSLFVFMAGTASGHQPRIMKDDSEYTPFAEELEGSAKKTKGKKQRTKIINIIKISIIAVVAIAGLIIITLNFTNYPILISQFNKIIILSLIVLNIL